MPVSFNVRPQNSCRATFTKEYMNLQTSNNNVKTKIWKNSPDGKILVNTLPGLPYGTGPKAFIPNLGQAALTGVLKSGSGAGEMVVEVEYTLI